MDSEEEGTFHFKSLARKRTSTGNGNLPAGKASPKMKKSNGKQAHIALKDKNQVKVIQSTKKKSIPSKKVETDILNSKSQGLSVAGRLSGNEGSKQENAQNAGINFTNKQDVDRKCSDYLSNQQAQAHGGQQSTPKSRLAVSKSGDNSVIGGCVDDQRCPFCQVPFSILLLQSPNAHTMECMDIPLKTEEECPAGLMCDSTILSHFRRYRHLQLALHIAGQTESFPVPDPGKDLDHAYQECSEQRERKAVKRVSSAEDSSCGMNCKNGSNTEKKGSSAPKRTKRGSVISRSRDCIPSATPNSSQGQGSQDSSCSSRSSIKAYFSPDKKGSHSGMKQPPDGSGDAELWEVHTASDSDSDTEVIGVCEIRNGVKENDTASQQSEELFCSSSEEESISEVGGFFLGLSQEESASASTRKPDADADVQMSETEANCEMVTSSLLTPTLKKSKSLMDFSAKGMSASTLCKQTSLVSFFKPSNHNSNKGNRPEMKASPSVTKQSNTKGLEKNISKWQLVKSVSEPESLRIPSPPPSFPTKHEPVPFSKKVLAQNGKLAVSAVGSRRERQSWSERPCPFYKKIPGTAITVDAFCYGDIPGCQAYVLSHFHYDHYRGLTKQFGNPIYCSSVTANLVEKMIGVPSHQINRLPLNTPCQVVGVQLTLMEANHCPGAVIILFELLNGRKILHTGDFRADPEMEQYPPLQNILVDELYLDTTYCNPAYVFPPQRETVQFAVTTALKAVERDPGTLVVCGAYTIGKERIFLALAEALQSKLCVQSNKKRVLNCLEDENLKNMISLRWTDGRVHVLPMGQLRPKGLESHLQQCPGFTSILAFEPTGWTHSNKVLSLDNIRPKYSRNGVTLFGVPYSEHSSFLELKRFVQFLCPKRILPTVNNGSAASCRKMEVIFRQWMSEGQDQMTGTKKDVSKNASQQSLGGWLKK